MPKNAKSAEAVEPVESTEPVAAKPRKHTPKEFRIAVKVDDATEGAPEGAALYYLAETRAIKNSGDARNVMADLAIEAGHTLTMIPVQCGPAVTLVVEKREEIVVREQPSA